MCLGGFLWPLLVAGPSIVFRCRHGCRLFVLGKSCGACGAASPPFLGDQAGSLTYATSHRQFAISKEGRAREFLLLRLKRRTTSRPHQPTAPAPRKCRRRFRGAAGPGAGGSARHLWMRAVLNTKSACAFVIIRICVTFRKTNCGEKLEGVISYPVVTVCSVHVLTLLIADECFRTLMTAIAASCRECIGASCCVDLVLIACLDLVQVRC